LTVSLPSAQTLEAREAQTADPGQSQRSYGRNQVVLGLHILARPR